VPSFQKQAKPGHLLQVLAQQYSQRQYMSQEVAQDHIGRITLSDRSACDNSASGNA
jgi:hypothetical protein